LKNGHASLPVPLSLPTVHIPSPQSLKEDFRRWVVEKGDIAMVGMESAILLEAGFKQEVDFVVMVKTCGIKGVSSSFTITKSA